MLQVYDRVIASASQVTLVMLTIVLLVGARRARRPRLRARARAHAGERAPRPDDGRARARGHHGERRQGRAADEPDAARFRHLPAVRYRRRASMPCSICPGRRSTSSSFSCCIRCSALFALVSAITLVVLAVFGQWRVQGPMAESSAIGFAQLRLHRHEPAQRRGGAGHGHDARPAAALEPRPQPGHRAAGRRQRPRGQQCQHDSLSAPLHAVAHPRARRLSRDRPADHGRRHVRRQHPARSRAAAGRADRRHLAQT